MEKGKEDRFLEWSVWGRQLSTQDPFSLAAGIPPIEGQLRPTPKISARLSKKVSAGIVLFISLLVGLFLYSLNEIDAKPDTPDESSTHKDQNGRTVKQKKEDLPEELRGGKKTGPLSPSLAKLEHKDAATPPTTTAAQGPGATRIPPAPSATEGMGNLGNATQVPPMGSGQIPPSGGQRQLTPEEQAQQAARVERTNRMRQARSEGLEAKGFSVGGSVVTSQDAARASLEATRAAIEQAAKQGSGGLQDAAAIAAMAKQQGGDSEQNEKLDFVKNRGKEDHGYHPHVPQAALSNKEIKIGHLIPARLEQGVNSDLPGYVTAKTSEWVYDTVTGCLGLIPPLSTLVGKYDSKVALGQQRVLALWNALVFPDGSQLNLDGMQGYDTSGMAGMQAEVDNHYMRIFGIGLGMSLITATTQASVPQSSQTSTGVNTAPTYGQTVATAMAQQYGQLGAQLIGKYAAVQPTLKNYPGESFNIMVPRTIMFAKVWRNRCIKPTPKDVVEG